MTLYCSCIGAVLTWVLILLVTSALLSTAMWQFIPSVNLQLNTILPYSIAIFLCACLACAGTVITMSLSGMLFTNLLLTTIILFFPRICEAFLHAMVTSGLPFLVDYTPEISGNLLTSFTFMLFRTESLAELLLSGCKPYVYTPSCWRSCISALARGSSIAAAARSPACLHPTGSSSTSIGFSSR
ncbi:MAG: hypothetical protein LUC50_01695 [Ruminococcus sp.]|nr:hypothetical protein [Ruminococcus sp.]